MSSLTDLSATQALHLLQEGEISSLELTQAYLDRIQQLEPQIEAFITLTPELALEQAKSADRLRKNNTKEDLPALLGLPIAVKDVLALADVRCTCGSHMLENFIPPYTATSVQRLVHAGVVVLGKTNTDEFAMGSSTENSAYQTTHNPWNLDHVPGGSSGGSAAAVSAGMAPIALGSDTGGSVRQPASFCGVTGLKPTYGRVSRFGLIAYGSSLDSVGLFSHSAADLALIFEHIAGLDPRDATSMDMPVPLIDLDTNSDLSGVRIGVPKEYFITGIQAEVEQKVLAAIQQFKALGAKIVEISLPHTEYALPVYYLIATAEASANLARFDGVRFGYSAEAASLWERFKQSRGTGFGPEVKRRIMLGTYALSAGYYDAYYGQAQKVRTLIKRDFEQAFEQVDAIATPVAPTTAFKIGEHSNDPLAMYLEDIFTLPTNLAGVPGLAFPVGFDQQGLPIGMQFMGPHFKEEVLIKLVHAYQNTTDWHHLKPDI
ncbi:MAG: Asp-tRNA(Asn)/Glu-tRNA(Gln) amidotransferase subunit GatA [Anaerolineaceae bacterium]|mgnify:CR=1 FL=1|jgi:aspartyl-tRNA(Asn)/glutamyl-tRNA(Gln) amidotransferase subunit A|nr:Asp-tRNA(Asn)/Glu-tRNA(Gln) amidotransferase subunit GatA [Anaerolineaceae bacterium]